MGHARADRNIGTGKRNSEKRPKGQDGSSASQEASQAISALTTSVRADRSGVNSSFGSTLGYSSAARAWRCSASWHRSLIAPSSPRRVPSTPGLTTDQNRARHRPDPDL